VQQEASNMYKSLSC